MSRMPHAERRRAIVRAAMKGFARTGFRGTRTRDLAEAAGVSEALLYKFFPSKQALQKAIIEERIRQTGPPPFEDWLNAPPERVLPAMAARFFALCSKDPTFMRLLLFSALEKEPLAPMFFGRHVSANIDRLAGLIRQWIRRGRVRKGIDARLAAWTYVAAVVQLMIYRHIYGVRRMEDGDGELSAKVANLFLQGIST